MKKVPYLITCHGRPTIRIAVRFGWLPGARYTNLRDIRGFTEVGLIDIDWQDYSFPRHLAAVRSVRPLLTVARDIESVSDLPRVLDQAHELARFARFVIIVPKDPRLADGLKQRIPGRFVLGYSVPTRHGRTPIPLHCFEGRPVHLLGGRPDVQLKIAQKLRVHSVDVNRFTLDATYGDYFDGTALRPHPVGGYRRCVRDSIRNITKRWRQRLKATDGR